MTADKETQLNSRISDLVDSNSRFSEKLRQDQRELLHQTRELLQELCERMDVIDANAKLMRQQLDLLATVSGDYANFAKSIEEIHRWQREVKGPIEAATKLDHATHGARLVVFGIFGVAVCILSVAGVLELVHRTWSQLVR